MGGCKSVALPVDAPLANNAYAQTVALQLTLIIVALAQLVAGAKAP
jgi:hypothetical protein